MTTGLNVKFQGSKIQIATTKATAKTITDISNSSPAVVTATAHGYIVGTPVYIAGILGMTELNGKWYTATAITANTFELRGIDSSGYGPYVSGGTAQAGVLVDWCELKNWNESGGATGEIDVTTSCSPTKEYEAGLPDTATVSIDYNYVPKGTTQLFLDAAKAAGDTIPMRVVFPGAAGRLDYFVNLLKQDRVGAIDDIWRGSASLRIKQDPLLT
jgi:Ubiquitin-activating enzyme E1 FCCH domain